LADTFHFEPTLESTLDSDDATLPKQLNLGNEEFQMYSEKLQFVTSRFLEDSVASKKATLLIRRPDGSTFYHNCRELKKVWAARQTMVYRHDSEHLGEVSLHGGEVIECVEGAVKLMDLGSVLMWKLYSKPGPFQSRRLLHTPEGHRAYIALDRKGYLIRGEAYPTDWQAVRQADQTYQPKFAGGSNR
jgi:hypothetical protein